LKCYPQRTLARRISLLRINSLSPKLVTIPPQESSALADQVEEGRGKCLKARQGSAGDMTSGQGRPLSRNVAWKLRSKGGDGPAKTWRKDISDVVKPCHNKWWTETQEKESTESKPRRERTCPRSTKELEQCLQKQGGDLDEWLQVGITLETVQTLMASLAWGLLTVPG
jgi:hypothetical protein